MNWLMLIFMRLLAPIFSTVYLLAIQYFTRVGGKISMKLIKYENDENVECRANSLVYKVFGLYFMQSYIGIFYHALLHSNFMTLIQRLLISEVIENILENSIPYLSYSFNKFRARNKLKREKTNLVSFQEWRRNILSLLMQQVLARKSKMGFLMNNIAEIRADALKLLVMMKRPIPRADATIVDAEISSLSLAKHTLSEKNETSFTISVPPTRSDILHPCDVAEVYRL